MKSVKPANDAFPIYTIPAPTAVKGSIGEG